MKKIVAILIYLLLMCSALSQSGQLPAGWFWGNPGNSAGPPRPANIGTILGAYGAISATGSGTLATTACWRLLTLSGNAFYTYSIGAANTYPANCWVAIRNGDALVSSGGRGKKISINGAVAFRANGNVIYPGETIVLTSDGSTWSVNATPRWAPPSALTLYVGSSGSDSNDCLSNGISACATFAGALNILCQALDNIPGVTIQLDSSNMTMNFTSCPYVGSGSVVINGNNHSLVGSITIGSATLGSFGTWYIENIQLAPTANGLYGIFCGYSSVCVMEGGISFQGLAGPPTLGSAIVATNNANLFITANFSIAANWNAVFEADDSGRLHAPGITVTLTSSPFFNYMVVAHGAGAIASITSLAWSGSVFTGVTQYNVNLGGLIDDGNCAGIPGSISGITGTFGLGCN